MTANRIVARLRARSANPNGLDALMDDAADEIERLRALLKPFADYARRIDESYDSQGYGDACPVGLKPEVDGAKEIVHLSDLRRARRAYEQQAPLVSSTPNPLTGLPDTPRRR